MGGSHICADYSPSFTVVGADMFLRQFGLPSPTFRIGVPEPHICADYSPSFTVVGADMFLRNNIHHSDWSFSYSVESRVFVPIAHRLSRWLVRICFSSILFKIKIIRFHILSGEAYLCRLRTVFHGGRCGYVSPTVRIGVPATIFEIQIGPFHILL